MYKRPTYNITRGKKMNGIEKRQLSQQTTLFQKLTFSITGQFIQLIKSTLIFDLS